MRYHWQLVPCKYGCGHAPSECFAAERAELLSGAAALQWPALPLTDTTAGVGGVLVSWTC